MSRLHYGSYVLGLCCRVGYNIMWLAQMGTNTVGNLSEESIVIVRN